MGCPGEVEGDRGSFKRSKTRHLGVRELAALDGVSQDTVSRLERGEALRARTIAIRSALEARGVEFTNGDRPGVRLCHDGGRPQR